MRFTFDRRTIALVVAVVAAAACRSSTGGSRGGRAPSGGQARAGRPDARRGSGVRLRRHRRACGTTCGFPAQGPLVPQSATELGTILIQPGVTVGDLRFDLRGLSSGALVDEGTLKIPAASATGGTFDVTLASALPADSDGDGVPDPIDDCPSVPDPKQAGCPTDGGVTDAAIGRRDAAADARPDAAGPTRAARTPAGWTPAGWTRARRPRQGARAPLRRRRRMRERLLQGRRLLQQRLHRRLQQLLDRHLHRGQERHRRSGVHRPHVLQQQREVRHRRRRQLSSAPLLARSRGDMVAACGREPSRRAWSCGSSNSVARAGTTRTRSVATRG